ncbi:MAG TPA: hypothetical protein VKA46_01540 [Gemmataceae bacterium]|nr:hypothetical protein [Gemmataceae bacterium]
MSKTATAPKRSPRLPIEEPIFVRYSPHHEFPLSTVTSIGLHALIIGLLVIGGIVIAKLNWGADQKPVEANAVAMELPGGGGGNPHGVGNGPGDGALGDPDAPEAPLPDDPFEIQPREKLQEARKEARQLPEFKDEEDQRLINEGGAAVDKILRLRSDVRQKLKEGLAAGKGKGGPGNGGGEGTRSGTGSGDSTGPGSGGSPSKRADRLLRWTLIFNTRDGQDYMRQLKACGAIIAIYDVNAREGYVPIRDLNRPTPRLEDTIGRIYWVDDKPISVQSLAGALGVEPPSRFLVFFPGEFEEKLLRLEQGYRGKKENEIIETKFDIRRHGDTYEPVVIQQR